MKNHPAFDDEPPMREPARPTGRRYKSVEEMLAAELTAEASEELRSAILELEVERLRWLRHLWRLATWYAALVMLTVLLKGFGLLPVPDWVLIVNILVVCALWPALVYLGRPRR